MPVVLVAVIVLAIVALLAYFAGHRQGQAWGKPVLALAVLGLVGVVGYRVVAGPGDRRRQVSDGQEDHVARLRVPQS